MKRLHLVSALALVIAVNAVVFVGIVRNRTGSPDAALALTERELVLDLPSAREENSGLALQLDWRREFVSEWFDEGKLAGIGFTLPADDSASAHHFRQLPIEAFVVLEYEGRAWRRHKKEQEAELVKLRRKAERGEIDAEQAKREREQIDADLRAGSRLFAVDVGSDPQMLRSQYPDGGRYIIAPALVRLSYRSEGRQRRPYGIVDSVLVDRLHVPRRLAEPLLALPEEGRLYRGYVYYQRGKTLAPRYSVQVRWGRGFEPWIAGVQLLKGD